MVPFDPVDAMRQAAGKLLFLTGSFLREEGATEE